MCECSIIIPAIPASPINPPPTHHHATQMTRRIHELLPLGLQHALRDRYLGSVFDGGVKASALLVGLRYPTAVLKYVLWDASGPKSPPPNPS
jgi:hypothetical protein